MSRSPVPSGGPRGTFGIMDRKLLLYRSEVLRASKITLSCWQKLMNRYSLEQSNTLRVFNSLTCELRHNNNVAFWWRHACVPHSYIIFWSQPWITQMLFVGLNDSFSCQEFNSLLCNCSVKGWRDNTMRKTTCRVCDVTSSPFPSASRFTVPTRSDQIRSDQDAGVFSVLCPHSIRNGGSFFRFPSDVKTRNRCLRLIM